MKPIVLLAGAVVAAGIAAGVTEPHWVGLLATTAAAPTPTAAGAPPSSAPAADLFTPPAAVPSTLPSPLATLPPPSPTASPFAGSGQARALVTVTTLPWTPEECRFAWGYLGADAQDDHDASVRYQQQGKNDLAVLYATVSSHWVILERVASTLCGQPGPWMIQVSTVDQGLGWLAYGRSTHLYDEQVHGLNQWDTEWAGIYDRLISLFQRLPR